MSELRRYVNSPKNLRLKVFTVMRGRTDEMVAVPGAINDLGKDTVKIGNPRAMDSTTCWDKRIGVQRV